MKKLIPMLLVAMLTCGSSASAWAWASFCVTAARSRASPVQRYMAVSR